MINEIKEESKSRMEGAVKVLVYDLSAIRTGRATPALLDHVKVDYYGTPTAINQLAVVTVPEPRTIAIRPFSPSDIKTIEKAILNSDLGINPSNDGKIIRLNIPRLTEERRKNLAKQVKRRDEEARVAVRNIRRDAISDLRDFEKEGMITEDDLHQGMDEIQKLTDKYTERISKIGEEKITEILEV